MGRPSQGWKLSRKPGRNTYNVKFTHGGREFELSTKETDEAVAKKRAAEIYAGVVTGSIVVESGKRSKNGARPLGPVTSAWIDSVAGSLDLATANTYADYCDKLFVPYFKTVDAITSASVGEYVRARLGRVLAKTAKKELGVLLQICEFLGLKIERPKFGKKTLGTRKRPSHYVELSKDEVARILALLPDRKIRWGRRSGSQSQLTAGQPKEGWPVRARYIVAYETTLRPETINNLRVPEHYTRGSTHLRITDEIDKARFGRELPLTQAARDALDEICPDEGLIFGRFKNQKLLRQAALEAGVDPVRASRFNPYDFRRARLTHLADDGKLTAAQWFAGHKRISTTAIYARGSLRAAEEAIK